MYIFTIYNKESQGVILLYHTNHKNKNKLYPFNKYRFYFTILIKNFMSTTQRLCWSVKQEIDQHKTYKKKLNITFCLNARNTPSCPEQKLLETKYYLQVTLATNTDQYS